MENTKVSSSRRESMNVSYTATLEITLQNVINDRDSIKKQNEQLIEYIKKQANIINILQDKFGDAIKQFIVPYKSELGKLDKILAENNQKISSSSSETIAHDFHFKKSSSELFSTEVLDIASGIIQVSSFETNKPSPFEKKHPFNNHNATNESSSAFIKFDNNGGSSLPSAPIQLSDRTSSLKTSGIPANNSNNNNNSAVTTGNPIIDPIATNNTTTAFTKDNSSTAASPINQLQQYDSPNINNTMSSTSILNTTPTTTASNTSPSSTSNITPADMKKQRKNLDSQRVIMKKNLPGITTFGSVVRRGSVESDDSQDSTTNNTNTARLPSLLDILNESRMPNNSSSSSSSPSPAATQKKPRNHQRDLLYAQIDNYTIEIVGCPIKKNEKLKEIVTFIIAVKDIKTSQHKWKVEKLYSDFLDLDQKIKNSSSNRSLHGKLAKLPEKNLFNSHSPSKSDQRRLALELYLQKALTTLVDRRDLVDFLASDFVEENNANPTVKKKYTGTKEGYLFKKGKNLGGWKTRYFILRHALLDYFESKDSDFLGTIKLKYCLVEALANSDDTDERHGFALIEYKKGALTPECLPPNKPPGDSKILAKNVLCAESDQERDEWVAYMVAHMNKARAIQNRSQSKEGTTGKPNESNAGSSYPVQSNEVLNKDSQQPRNAPIPIVKDIHTAFQSVHSSNDSVHSGYSFPKPNNVTSSIDNISTASYDGHQATRTNSSLNKGPLPTAHHPASGLMHNNTASDGAGSNGTKPFVDENERILSKPAPPCLTDEHKLGESSSSAALNSSANYKRNKDESKMKALAMNVFGKKKNSNSDPSRRIFGLPLEQVVSISRIKEGYEMPAIVYRCIEYLEAKHAIKEEGIYRLSGSSATIQQLRERFNQEYDIDLLSGSDYYDVHAVAGLLKLFLRELPNPILTHPLQKEFLHVTDLLERNDRISELSRLVARLPLPNYTILRALAAHLIRVVQNCPVNKMTVRNISIVFSPTLNIPAGILTLMLAEYGIIFCGETFEQNGLNKSEGDLVGLSTSSVAAAAITQASTGTAGDVATQPLPVDKGSIAPVLESDELMRIQEPRERKSGLMTNLIPPSRKESNVASKRTTHRNSLQYEDSVPEALRQLESGIKKLEIVEDGHSEAVADFYTNYASEEILPDIAQDDDVQHEEEFYDDRNSVTASSVVEEEEEVVIVD